MATKTSIQTGTTSTPFASNTQDFSGSDDDILDNFAEGPDDGVPLGVGGEKGKQAEPASSTLEADIVNGTTKQSGEEIPPDESASEAQPVQEPAGETGPETSPEPSTSAEPETPEIPPMLLQMAGYADVDAAKAAGYGSPELLRAYIAGRGQLLASQPAEPVSGQPPYGQPVQRQDQTPPPPAQPPPADSQSEFKPFELSESDVEVLDERLVDVVNRLNAHNQRQFDDLRNAQLSREQQSAEQQEVEEVLRFDEAVQNLGEDWQDLFGEGSADSLSLKGRTDPSARLALDYRRELLEEMRMVRRANAEGVLGNLDLNGEIAWSLQQRFPDKFQQTVSGNSSKANGSTTRRTSLNRPTQRKTPDTRQDQLLARLHKSHPGAGFTATGEDEFDGEI